MLPYKAITVVARFSFHALLIPLIYSTTASSVTPSSLQDYWFVIVAAFVVLLLSYLAATLLQVCFRVQSRDFQALRISSTFPNVVAIPILIFPSLCEYDVIQQGYFGDSPDDNLALKCVSVSNAMIFCYFFSWSLAFWSFGYPQLLATAKRTDGTNMTDDTNRRLGSHVEQQSLRTNDTSADSNDSKCRNSNHGRLEAIEELSEVGVPLSPELEGTQVKAASEAQPQFPWLSSAYKHFCQTCKQILRTAPFWALALGIVTGCIGPLRNALFTQGGALRFIGSALESLGQASSPITTIVVAASLVPEPVSPASTSTSDDNGVNADDDSQSMEESPIMSDPTVGPQHLRRRSSIIRFKQSIRNSSTLLLGGRSNPELRKQLIWFTLNRLLLAPALVTGVLMGFDCGGLLGGIPDLAKLVIIVNACVPGAFIVVVVLKQKEEMAELAEVVARVYLPTYLLSIVTVAGWTALGLWLTLPDANGETFCDRRG
ncbi:hypothetical protein MPSEU_000462300 [Mayamaea pseudoterrestris]|nr:hypothetical protein MPSEU_000462300 [Mayamaea pseudoterrestris]